MSVGMVMKTVAHNDMYYPIGGVNNLHCKHNTHYRVHLLPDRLDK